MYVPGDLRGRGWSSLNTHVPHQTTEEASPVLAGSPMQVTRLSIWGTERGKRDGPAPVVPPERFDMRMVGDWWMDKSLPAIVSSRTFAFGLSMPSAWDGNV